MTDSHQNWSWPKIFFATIVAPLGVMIVGGLILNALTDRPSEVYVQKDAGTMSGTKAEPVAEDPPSEEVPPIKAESAVPKPAAELEARDQQIHELLVSGSPWIGKRDQWWLTGEGDLAPRVTFSPQGKMIFSHYSGTRAFSYTVANGEVTIEGPERFSAELLQLTSDEVAISITDIEETTSRMTGVYQFERDDWRRTTGDLVRLPFCCAWPVIGAVVCGVIYLRRRSAL